MSKVTIIGATGNVGMFAAYAISAHPTFTRSSLYGREGRESLLKGIAQDFIDSFAARGTNVRITWTTNLKDVAGSDIVVITAGTPPARDRIVSILRSGMPGSLRRSPGRSALSHLTQRSSW